jgi:rhamnulokinase
MSDSGGKEKGHVVAVDLGASSGRVTKVGYDGERFKVEEVHRFSNIPVRVGDSLQWDIKSIWEETTKGIKAASKGALSIGVDTWGVDFALLDSEGSLLGNPVHYRDERTTGMMNWVFERVPRREIFERTGIQFISLNTLYQIASLVKNHDPVLKKASCYLGMPDLIHYWLTGAKACELTHATTTQMLNLKRGDWDRETLDAIEIPTNIFPSTVGPGTRLGEHHGVSVVAPACHDTASAVVAVPTTTENHAYLSSGTWSLLGLELDDPLINDDVYDANMTNEGGAEGRYRLLKNLAGLWLEQECRRAWKSTESLGLDYYIREAEKATPFTSIIDPDHPSFLAPGDMPSRIREYCDETHQMRPGSAGQMIRVVYESLALKYRVVLEQLVELTGRTVECLHVIGGGAQNALLCQMTANSTGVNVIAGPVEATTLGNAIIQLISMELIEDVNQAREALAGSLNVVTYHPENHESWDEGYRFLKGLIDTE